MRKSLIYKVAGRSMFEPWPSSMRVTSDIFESSHRAASNSCLVLLICSSAYLTIPHEDELKDKRYACPVFCDLSIVSNLWMVKSHDTDAFIYSRNQVFFELPPSVIAGAVSLLDSTANQPLARTSNTQWFLDSLPQNSNNWPSSSTLKPSTSWKSTYTTWLGWNENVRRSVQRS